MCLAGFRAAEVKKLKTIAFAIRSVDPSLFGRLIAVPNLQKLVSVGAGAVGNRTYHLRCDRDFFHVRRYYVKGSAMDAAVRPHIIENLNRRRYLI